jgi:hypothetical protein
MKETIKTPAAPQPQQSSYSDGGPAISLRDWFAGQALAGLQASVACNWTSDEFATQAYKAADAMLKAREVLP